MDLASQSSTSSY